MYIHPSRHTISIDYTPRAKSSLILYNLEKPRVVSTYAIYLPSMDIRYGNTHLYHKRSQFCQHFLDYDAKRYKTTTTNCTRACIRFLNAREDIDKDRIGGGKCPGPDENEREEEGRSLGEVINRNLCACGEHNRGEQWYRKWNIRDATILAQIRMKRSKITRYGRPRYATVYISPLYRGEE